jgi:DNA-binding response OmpR family regulator
MRILLVEDNSRLAEFVAKGLTSSGFAVDSCLTKDEAEAALRTTRYDTVILDLGLPDGDGMDLLADLRARSNSVPVLVLTARDGLGDRVQALNGGADDYVLKPFEMEELSARIRALLRRPGAALGTVLSAGNITFDTALREVSVSGVPMRMPRRELGALEVLMRRMGRVVPKDVMEEHIYGFDDRASANAVEVAVHRLRRRLSEADTDVRIDTLRGVGYLLAESVPSR